MITPHDIVTDGVAGCSLPVSQAFALQRHRLSSDVAAELRRWGPHALVVVGTEGPLSVTLLEAGGQVVKRRFGHNRGVWPMRLASSAAWKDTVTATYDKSPFAWTGALIRVWCASDAHAGRLAVGVADLMGRLSEEAAGAELRSGWTDLGPDLQPALLEMEIHALAGRLGFEAWDDDGLLRELERRVRGRMLVR